jgi:hypothetical protein
VRIAGLEEFLIKRGATAHVGKIKTWCLTNGAASLSEIVENWEDVLDYLALSAGERKHLSELPAGADAEPDQDLQLWKDHNERGAERIRTWLQKNKAKLSKNLADIRVHPSGAQTESLTALTIGHLTVIGETDCPTF